MEPNQQLIPKAFEQDDRNESPGATPDGWFVESDSNSTRVAYRLNKTLHEEQSAYQSIGIYESNFFGRFLSLDNTMMFTERDEFVYHEMLSHIPLCSMQAPESVLIIGGGDCGCLREVLKHDCVKRVVQCDIDERVTAVCEQYFPWIAAAKQDPRAELLFADGVEFIRNNPGTFDLVMIDSTDPVGPGVGLFLRSFYQDVAAALKPGGVMVAQTESPHWGADLVVAIYQEMRAAFDQVASYLAWIPTYPSGSWSLGYASAQRKPGDYFDAERAQRVAKSCRYYNPAIHSACFVLPTFVQQELEGTNPFASFDEKLNGVNTKARNVA